MQYRKANKHSLFVTKGLKIVWCHLSNWLCLVVKFSELCLISVGVSCHPYMQSHSMNNVCVYVLTCVRSVYVDQINGFSHLGTILFTTLETAVCHITVYPNCSWTRHSNYDNNSNFECLMKMNAEFCGFSWTFTQMCSVSNEQCLQQIWKNVYVVGRWTKTLLTERRF